MIPTRLSRAVPPALRARGDDYFRLQRVRIVNANPTALSAVVTGTVGYVVQLHAEPGFLGAACSCPYSEQQGICKHIWAAMRQADHEGRLHGLLETTGTATDLAPVIDNASQFCKDYLECANSPRIEFTNEIDSEFYLKGDPAQWERVLVNLFLNSAQAGARNIHIQARQREIIVSDDGPGISAELLPRIFQPRVSTKSIISGLGLYVVQSIVEQNGGTVSAANGPRGGAVFTLRV